MSYWTHVNGSIRINHIRFEEEDTLDFDEIFGKEWDYGEWDKAEEEYCLPSGSEGSLKKSVWVNPELHSVPAYVVTIFGDLRDVESEYEFDEWLNKITETIGLAIRSLIFRVDIDYRKSIIYTWNGEQIVKNCVDESTVS